MHSKKISQGRRAGKKGVCFGCNLAHGGSGQAKTYLAKSTLSEACTSKGPLTLHISRKAACPLPSCGLYSLC